MCIKHSFLVTLDVSSTPKFSNWRNQIREFDRLTSGGYFFTRTDYETRSPSSRNIYFCRELRLFVEG